MTAALCMALLVSGCRPLLGQSTTSENYLAGVLFSSSYSSLTAPVSQLSSGSSTILTLTLRDSNGNPYYGASPTVSVSYSGGTSTGTLGSAVYESDGVYEFSFTAAQAGTAITFTAEVNGLALTSSEPSLQVVPSSSSAISVVSGNSQSAVVGTALPLPLVVAVRDANGNLVPGAMVTWSVSSGTLLSASTTTQDSGQASNWLTLSTTSDIALVTATVYGTSDSVSFTATGTPAPVSAAESTIAATPTLLNADGTSTSALAVILLDQYGNPVSGKQVTVASNRGAFDSLSAASGPSSVSGEVDFTVSSTHSGQALFTATDTTDSIAITPSSASVNFLPGGAPQLSILSGNDQTGQVGSALSSPVAVLVEDIYGNPLSSVTIDWSITSGGGSLSSATSSTDGSGSASVTWTLGTTVGAKQLTATVHGTTTSVSLSATATAGAASQIAIASGNLQSAVAGSLLGTPLAVQVEDAYGNSVSGAEVDWTVISGGGSLSTGSGTSDSSGQTTDSLTLGTTDGVNTIKATLHGTSTSVSFTETATSGSVSATLSTITSSTSSLVADGAASATLTVALKDANGNPVSGITVTPSSTRGASDVITPATAVSNSSGNAVFTVTSIHAGNATFSATDTTDSIPISPSTAAITFTAGSPASITITAGNNQTGTVGSALSTPLTVVVKDANGNAVSGSTINWTTSSGQMTPTSNTTSSSGLASSTLTLGTTAGGNTSTATVNGTSLSAAFSATAVAGPAATIAISSGNAQSGTAGSALASPLAVVIKDADGNVVSGTQVNWSIASGGGTVSASSSQTNGSGIATINLTLGTAAGSNSVTATLASTSSMVTFTATGNAGAAATISLSSGNNQSANAGSALSSPLSVIAKDVNGNVVNNATVTWVISSGGGSLSSSSTSTNSSGIASDSLTLGTVNGTNTATATLQGTSSTVIFTEIGATGGVSSSVSTIAANPTSVTANGIAASTITVTLKDSNSNPVSGKTVTLTSSRGATDTISAASGASDGSGVVTFTVTSTTAGSSTYTATDSTDTITLSAQPAVSFVAGAATQIALSGGNLQTATVGTLLPTALSAVVKDANSNVVNGVQVDWAITAGGGSLSAANSTTNSSGLASDNLTLGTTAGTNTVTATIHGTSTSAGFTETGTASTAVAITLSSGNSQSGTAGSALASVLAVVVKDTYGNVVSGSQVDWAVSSGGGTLSASFSDANSSGIASDSLTLGTVTGSNAVTATLHGTSSTVNFTATGAAGAATQLLLTSGNNQSGTAGAALTNPFTVQAEDANGNVVSGTQIDWAITAGGGSFASASTTTAGTGLTSDILTLGTLVGTNTATATIDGTSTSVTFTATGVAGAASTMTLNGGDAQSATVATTLPTAFSVIVKDANGNVVSGAEVDWAVTAGGGSLSSTTGNTNTSGIAASTLTLGTVSGTDTATATLHGTSTVVSFSATATPGAVSAAQSLVAANPTSITADGSTTSTITVSLKDSHGNGVSGKTVTLTSSRGATDTIGSASGASSSTGVVTFLVSSTVAGSSTYTATDSSDSLAITPASAGVSFTAGAASSITISSGNSQSGTAGSPLPLYLVALVKDANGNVVPNASVDWAVASGGGSLLSANTTASSSGLASNTFTLGTTAGTNTATATIHGTSTSVTFTATGTAGAASTIAISSGSAQSGTAGSALTNPLVAVVKDANGNVVTGTTVNWAVASGGGSLGSSTSTTSSGLASDTLTLGTTAGTNTVTATINGTSASVTFSETGSAGAATTIAISTGNTQTGTAGSALANPLVVLVKDANGNITTGTTINWAIASGGGSLGSSTSTTSSGLASDTLTLGTTAGTNTVTATINGTSTSVTFSATGNAGAAASIAVSSGNNQTGTGNAALGNPLVAVVEDTNGNAVSGVQVNWAITSSIGGTLGSATSTTNSSGLASDTLTLSNQAGTVTVTATINTTSTLTTFSETVTPVLPAAPSVTLASAMISNNATVQITVSSCTGVAKIFVNKSTQPAAGATGWQSCVTTAGGITYTVSSQGTNAMNVWSQDSYGNVSSSSSSLSMIYDTTAPTVALTSFNGGQNVGGGTTQSISWTASDANLGTTPITLSYSANNGSTWTVIASSLANSASPYSWTVPSINSSQVLLQVTATDQAGNSATATSTSDFTITSVFPSLSIGAPSTTLATQGPLSYTVTYTNATSVTLSASNVTLNTTGTATGTVSVSGTGTTTRTVTINSITGKGTLGISIAANSATDTAGGAPAAGPSATATISPYVAVPTSLPGYNSIGSNYAKSVYVDSSGNIYVSTVDGGLSISTNGGTSFTTATTVNGLMDNDVFQALYDGSGNLYVGTNGGLSISTNGGTSFSQIPVAGNPSHVYAISIPGNGWVYLGTSGGVVKSSNQFSSYTTYNTTTGLGNNTVNGIYVDSNYYIYAATNAGLSISTNGGTSFTNYESSYGFQSVVVDSSGNIYAGSTSNGLFVSSNLGASWTNYTTSSGLGGNGIRGIYKSPTTGYIYLATSGGLSISTNGTSYTNYTVANSGLGSNYTSAVTLDSNNYIYVATNGGGLSVSKNGGTTFTNYTSSTSLNAAIYNSNGNTTFGYSTLSGIALDSSNDIYVSTNAGVSISQNGGVSFSNYTSGLGSTVVNHVFVDSHGTVYAATNGGVSISTNGGTSYTNTTSGLGSATVNAIYVNSGGTIYAATNGGVSISTNSGTSYTNYTSGLSSTTVYSLTVDSSGYIYAATNGGLAISQNGGTSFTNYTTSNGLPSNTVRSVTVTSSKIYVCTASGLAVATLGSTTFTVPTGAPTNEVWEAYVDSSSNVYVSGHYGYYISTNGGTSFSTYTQTTLPGGFGGAYAMQTVKDSNGNIYVATDGGVVTTLNP